MQYLHSLATSALRQDSCLQVSVRLLVASLLFWRKYFEILLQLIENKGYPILNKGYSQNDYKCFKKPNYISGINLICINYCFYISVRRYSMSIRRTSLRQVYVVDCQQNCRSTPHIQTSRHAPRFKLNINMDKLSTSLLRLSWIESSKEWGDWTC